MRLRLLSYALPVAVLAGLVSTAGCSSPAAKPPATGGGAAAATPAVDGDSSTTVLTSTGNVHLTAYTDNDGPASTVILSGAVGDYGKAQGVNPDGSVKTEHNSQLSLMLTHGSFRLSIAELDKKFVAVLANLRVNTTTCSGTASVTAPVPVVAGSGVGSYTGIRGTFMLTITLDEVYQPSGCSETSGYLSQAIVIAGPGTVSVR